MKFLASIDHGGRPPSSYGRHEAPLPARRHTALGQPHSDISWQLNSVLRKNPPPSPPPSPDSTTSSPPSDVTSPSHRPPTARSVRSALVAIHWTLIQEARPLSLLDSRGVPSSSPRPLHVHWALADDSRRNT